MSALTITRADAVRAIRESKRLKSIIDNGKEHQEELAEGAVRTVLGAGASLGLGLLNGSGHGEVFGVPVTLGAGLTAHGLRLLGIFSGKSKFAEQLGTIGDVGVWNYLFALGVGMGSEHWGKKGGSHGTMGSTGGAFADRLAQIANST